MRLLGKMIVSLLFLAVKGDGQRYYCQNNAGADHATPSPSLPTASCKEGTQRAADEVSGHENRIYPIGGRRVDVENTGLVAELDTLHAYVYKNDTGNDTCIVVSAEKSEPHASRIIPQPIKLKLRMPTFLHIFLQKMRLRLRQCRRALVCR